MIITRILSRWSQPRCADVDYQSILPVIEEGGSIPKQIIQTCKSRRLLPEALISNIETIQSQNQGWEYVLFEDTDIERYLLESYGPVILSYFNRISPKYGAAKADFFRYLFLYKEGGVYLDIKSSTRRPLDEVLLPDDRFILSRWDNGPGEGHQGAGYYFDCLKQIPNGEVPQWFIISAKGHPILRDIIIRVLHNIDNYNPYVNGVGWSGTINTTGPIPYTLTIFENIDKYSFRDVGPYTNLGLEYSVFESSHGQGSTYHATAIKSDYRKNVDPVILSKSVVLEMINRCYLRLLSRNIVR